VFTHLPGPQLQSAEGFLGSVVHNLRPGGRFALQLPSAGFCPDLSAAVDACLARCGHGDRVPFFEATYWLPERQDLEHQLEQAGCREFDVTSKLVIERFETVTEASDHFLETSLEPLLAMLAAGQRPEFLEDLRRELLQRLGRAENLEVVFRRVFAYGRR
jgi:trans-aconitate methyltransferase